MGIAIASFPIVLNRYVKARTSAKKTSTNSPLQEMKAAVQALSYPPFKVPDSVIVYRAQQATVPVKNYSPKSSIDNAFGAIADYLTLSHLPAIAKN
ncbi:hypothetical protein [Leptothoe spongobia]|uniref:Uncharacterized protein n=1 Tax=Leptothoe spongobia TAU-MAC 1115 TaxID=1967444 RepID=A0A947GKF6_9CYAN|nr:hypothetical protein [Leptothoe spongobia]MBT9317364.1 hypothetical protein [Leptothoe spongobia TAU-MAC 1115]